MKLKQVSYYQTGGTCEELIFPKSVQELANAMTRIDSEKMPFFLLGAGSNSLVMDEHWPGAVILFEQMKDSDLHNDQFTVQAGVSNTQLAKQSLNASLSGAEWLYHLPGQLGATTRMNARCYGGEIGQIVKSVLAVTPQGKIKQYRGEGVFKGYKDTTFMTSGEIVAEVVISLTPGDPEQIRLQMDDCRSDREQKHQFVHPSCGCVFKNDYTAGVPSGLLLDKAGVRDLSSEAVMISPWHANFVFNRGASAIQILETTLQMRDAVYERFGVWLTFEMEILGQLPEDLKKRVYETREPRFNQAELALLRKSFAGGSQPEGRQTQTDSDQS